MKVKISSLDLKQQNKQSVHCVWVLSSMVVLGLSIPFSFTLRFNNMSLPLICYIQTYIYFMSHFSVLGNSDSYFTTWRWGIVAFRIEITHKEKMKAGCSSKKWIIIPTSCLDLERTFPCWLKPLNLLCASAKEQGIHKLGPECYCLLKLSGPPWIDTVTSIYLNLSNVRKTTNSS